MVWAPLIAPAEADYSCQSQEDVSKRGSVVWVLVGVSHFNPFDTCIIQTLSLYFFLAPAFFLVLDVSVSCRRHGFC